MSRVSTRRASKRTNSEVTENDAESIASSSRQVAPASSTKRRKQQKQDESVNMFENITWDRLYEEFILHKKDKLEDLVLRIFLHFGENTIDKKLMAKLIHDIAQQYNANKYHNFEHATHVLLNSAFSLTCIKEPFLSPIEKLSFLYSALIHDVDHYGIPNSTLIQNRHPLALLFHDQSVAENHSITIGLNHISNLTPASRKDCKYKQRFLETVLNPSEVLSVRSSKQYDVLGTFDEKEKALFRHNVIELVLNTDIADPYRRKNLYDKLLIGYNSTIGHHHTNTNTSSSSSSSGGSEKHTSTNGNQPVIKAYNHDAPINRLYFLSLLLRLADIGASTQSLTTFLTWSENFFLENYEAYEEELRTTSNTTTATATTTSSSAIESFSVPSSPNGTPANTPKAATSSSSTVDSTSTKKISAFYQSSARFYKNQIGYMESHPTHLIDLVEQLQLMNPEWILTVKNTFQMNLQHWKSNGKHIYQEWVNKHKYEALEDEA